MYRFVSCDASTRRGLFLDEASTGSLCQKNKAGVRILFIGQLLLLASESFLGMMLCDQQSESRKSMASFNPLSVFDIDQDCSSQELCGKSLRECRLERKLEDVHAKLSSPESQDQQPWQTSVSCSSSVTTGECNDFNSRTMDVDQQGDCVMAHQMLPKQDANPGNNTHTHQLTKNGEVSHVHVLPNTCEFQNHGLIDCESSSFKPDTNFDVSKDTLKLGLQKLETRNNTVNENDQLQVDIFKELCAASETPKLSSNGNEETSIIKNVTTTIESGISKCETEANKQQSVSLKSDKTFKPGCVTYVCSEELLHKCDALEKIPDRASMVHGLVDAYGLLKHVILVTPSPATEDSILQFHSSEYIEFLKKINDQDDEEIYDEEAAQFGLTYDCPIHLGIYDYATLVAGATICAAEQLVKGQSEVAINWFGGWHHAQKDSASGFCYINDIVLGILKLKEKYNRVLYVDLDLHHGDGVENAFSATSSVMTVSFHKYAAGFFPGSGSIEDVGLGKGKFYTVNVPLCDGIRDREFVALFCRVIQKVQDTFKPEAVVCQCGADGLAGDPMESFNLTHMALARCVYVLLNWKLPTLLLGGGGYNHSNTARCWTFLTSLAIGRKLPIEVPEHKYFIQYGPDYEINVTPGNRKDDNTREHIRSVYKTVIDNLGKITK